MSLSTQLTTGKPVFGTMLRILRNPAAMILARHAGLEFVMLDMEHSPYTFETLTDLVIPARAAGLAVLVRVPELARAYVSRALDCGVEGVMVPMLETPEQARRFVDWAKYPPLGSRGLSSTGPHSDFRKPANVIQFMAEANRDTLTIAQIETATAIENIEAIAGTAGIDVLLIGPNDLAVSLGKPGQLECPEEIAAITRVAEAARRHGKVFAMHAGPKMLSRWTSHGMRLFMAATDVDLIATALAALNKDLRAVVEGKG